MSPTNFGKSPTGSLHKTLLEQLYQSQVRNETYPRLRDMKGSSIATG